MDFANKYTFSLLHYNYPNNVDCITLITSITENNQTVEQNYNKYDIINYKYDMLACRIIDYEWWAPKFWDHNKLTINGSVFLAMEMRIALSNA